MYLFFFVFLFIYLLTPAYNLLEFVSLFITFFMCLIISFTGIYDINTRTFLFHFDDDIYILETIKTLTETNKCFYYRDPLRSFGEQENEGIYFRVIREWR